MDGWAARKIDSKPVGRSNGYSDGPMDSETEQIDRQPDWCNCQADKRPKWPMTGRQAGGQMDERAASLIDGYLARLMNGLNGDDQRMAGQTKSVSRAIYSRAALLLLRLLVFSWCSVVV